VRVLNRRRVCVWREQFKGGDEIRQDAVMEQVFGLVNKLLARERETRRRELRVRMYKVVPLMGDTGVIEFAANTRPMGDWLVSAHARCVYMSDALLVPKLTFPRRYYQDWAGGKARARLNEVKDEDPARRLEVFEEITKNVKPVMRHFFFENHKVPSRWFEMRLNYSRSVATSSIVGYVLGLGDRHVSNILLDKITGEVVPIDLGIAFDAVSAGHFSMGLRGAPK
jgi:ataxia telangiectasia mutated family protein